MSSEMARRFISNYLSEYFLNLNTKTLSLSFWSGYLNCENLKLNPQKFNENKNFPIHLQDGVISKINMSLPIKSFFLGINNDIEISIEDIDINSYDGPKARITVRNFLRMDTIGTEGHLVQKASYILHLEEAPEEKVRWKVRMEGLPQSERRNRD